MTPVLTTSGHYVRELNKGTVLAFVYNNEMRRGVVENGAHRSVICMKTQKGFQNFSRTKIRDLTIVSI
jgi:hypothetical protein